MNADFWNQVFAKESFYSHEVYLLYENMSLYVKSYQDMAQKDSKHVSVCLR